MADNNNNNDSATQLDITVANQQAYYQPGQQIRGNVSVNTAGGKSLTFAALRLVWTGRIVAQLAGQFDRKEYFNEVFHLDPNSDAFVHSSELSTPGTLIQVDGRATFSFQITLPNDRPLPSSFEINDTVMGATSNVEYVVEVALDHQTFDPMPIKARAAVPVMATSTISGNDDPSQQQQQTSEKTYLSTVLQDRAEYRTAARITVPFKVSPRGATIPVVAHVWHDCKYTRRNGISLSLVRMCKIQCGERTETLTKELSTVTRDLDLALRTGYSVQTLTETLQIPYDCVPSITEEQGELASVEYSVFLSVHAHPSALYTELPSDNNTSAMQYMLVGIPMHIDTQQRQPQQQQQQPSPPEQQRVQEPRYESSKIARGETSRFTAITTPTKDNNKKMTDRMKGMFRRRSKMDPVAGVPVLSNNNESSISVGSSSKGGSSLRQVMSSFRPRNNSNNSNSNTINSNGAKPQSSASSVNSGQMPSTTIQTSPAQSANSSITDVSKNLPQPQPQPQQLQSASSSHSPPPPPVAVPPSSPTPSSAAIPPPPSYVESKPAPETAPSPSSITASPMSPLPPAIVRAMSTHEKPLPTINSVPLPVVSKARDPIPGLEGGGVYTFHIFPDSDEEDDEEQKTPTSASTKVNGGSDEVTTTPDSNIQYFDMFPDSDDNDADRATEKRAVREKLTTLYPDAGNKLDQVSESESDHDDSDEDENDLLSVMARRERRIERAKVRSH
ncbi:hypothetical protein BDB00DRAFT_835962 [Zychaea mexicana]|uniref:uncharacterized protein n=1 Tax=Zychaea mexicana TaxID=64656 RepID=UPI0022FDE49F|nr:uncharacterized protein BDB00DRAFT_835962 [Zychaea mexicana]KAI9490918.1 hypothetical protein BDB00DRAFT_835962 [Zychaea mexicana]